MIWAACKIDHAQSINSDKMAGWLARSPRAAGRDASGSACARMLMLTESDLRARQHIPGPPGDQDPARAPPEDDCTSKTFACLK